MSSVISYKFGATPTLIFEIRHPQTKEIVNVSTASAILVRFKWKTDQLEVTGSLYSDGTDGKVKYKITSAESPQINVGVWRVEVHVTLTSGEMYTTSAEIEVTAKLF